MAKSNGKTKSSATAKATVSDQGEAARNVFEQMTSFGGDFGEIGRANMQAMTQSAQLAGKGFQTLGKAAMDFTSQSFERNIKMAKELGGVKTVQDFTTLQSDFAKETLQTSIEQMTEMAKLFAATVREVAEPMKDQAGMMAQKFQQSA